MKRLLCAVVAIVILSLAAFLIYDSRGLTGPVTTAAFSPPATVVDEYQVAVVQMRWDVSDYYCRETFARKVELAFEAARGAADPGLPLLIVFPEYVGTPCIFQGAEQALAEGTKLQGAIKAMVKGNLPSVLHHKIRYSVGWPQAVGLAKARIAGQTYVETFSSLAERYRYYVIAGSAVLPDFSYDNDGKLIYRVHSGELYNTCYFFGPDGKIIGTQKKVHLTELESEAGLGLTPGRLDDLKVYETPFGIIGIAVCLDAFNDEIVDKLIALGANVLVQPSANYGAWDQEQQSDWLRSSHGMVQAHPELQLALNPMMTGPLFELEYAGQSSICVPAAEAPAPRNYSALPGVPGFLMIADSHNTEQVLYTVIHRPRQGPVVGPLDVPGYTLIECRWYDETRALLALADYGEQSKLRLVVYDMLREACTVLYEGNGSVNYGDDIIVTDEHIGVQSYNRALVFDRETLRLVSDTTWDHRDGLGRYSHDMTYLAVIREDGLYIKDVATGKASLLDGTPKALEPEEQLGHGGLTWSPDDSKVIFIPDYGRSSIGLIDVASGEKTLLSGGQDFPWPESTVELLRCWVLPGDGDILVDVLRESDNVLLRLNADHGYASHELIDEDGRETVLMAVRDGKLLYAVRGSRAEPKRLVCYDYNSEERRVLLTTDDFIVGADFAPDGTKVLCVTLLDGKHRLREVTLAPQ